MSQVRERTKHPSGDKSVRRQNVPEVLFLSVLLLFTAEDMYAWKSGMLSGKHSRQNCKSNNFGNICNHNKVQQIIIRFGIRAEFASTTFIRKIKCRGKENPFKMKPFGIVQKNFHLIWLTAAQTVE